MQYTLTNKKGGAGAMLIGILVGLLVIAGIGFAWYTSNYNKAVRLEEGSDSQWSKVESALQRRVDLIPNLVNTVKGYATHEKDLFENIAEARTMYFSAKTPDDKMAASNNLSGLLSRLLVLKEAYPELKANQNFLMLQDQLEGTENRINTERMRYNDYVKTLNSYARSFFGGYFCKKAGVEKREYFEATEEAKTTVPEVKF